MQLDLFLSPPENLGKKLMLTRFGTSWCNEDNEKQALSRRHEDAISAFCTKF